MNFLQQMQHPDPIVAEAATILQDFTDQLNAGQMSEQEYQQLTYDVLDMQRIDQLAIELERKVAIQRAFQQLVQIAGIIGKFL